METKATMPEEEERVFITPPRGNANDEPNMLIAVNGVNYLLPRGKRSSVPKHIAEEFYRSQNAQNDADEKMTEMLDASSK